MEPPAHAEAATPGLVGRRDRLGAVDDQAAGREVGAVEHAHQLGMLDVGVVDQQ